MIYYEHGDLVVEVDLDYLRPFVGDEKEKDATDWANYVRPFGNWEKLESHVIIEAFEILILADNLSWDFNVRFSDPIKN